MLIEFRVKNFRSLRDEQVLSLVASNDKTLFDSHTMTTGVTAVPALLRSAVVYGANASGKSNLIINYKMHRATGFISIQLTHLYHFINNALTGNGRIAMQHNGTGF